MRKLLWSAGILLVLAITLWPLAGLSPVPMWRNDPLPLQKRFSWLDSLVNCVWVGSSNNDGFLSVPGPSTYFIYGVAWVKRDNFEKLTSGYSWESATIDTELLEKLPPCMHQAKIQRSASFSQKHLPAQFFGRILRLPDEAAFFIDVNVE